MSTRLSTIIVDDEPLARGLMRSSLMDNECIDIVAECKNGREALQSVANLTPDLMFLDIQMPGLNGVEVVKAIQADVMPMVVFATAYEKYAVEAFTVNAIDYLLKPIEEQQVERAVKRALERKALNEDSAQRKQQLLSAIASFDSKSDPPSNNAAEPKKLAIKDGREIDMVDLHDIDWVDAAGDLMCIHCGGKTYLMRSTMKDLMQQLNHNNFARIHRSTIVNLDRIQKIVPHIKGEYFIHLVGDTKLKVSRGFKEVINDYLAGC